MRYLLFIFIVFGFIPRAESKEDTLLLLGKLYGLAHFVQENEEVSDDIVSLCLEYSKGSRDIDFNQVVDQLMPKQPKAKYKRIDTSQLFMVYDLDYLMNHSNLLPVSKTKIEYMYLSKKGAMKKVRKEVQVFQYKNNLPLDSLNAHKAMDGFLRLWNAIDYFYPHKESLPKSWDQVYLQYVDSLLTTQIGEKKRYVRCLAMMCAELNDGHASLERLFDKKAIKKHGKQHKKDEKSGKAIKKDSMRYNRFPIKVEMHNDSLYITNKIDLESLKNFEIGDRILSINNQTPIEILNSLPKRPASRPELFIIDRNATETWLYFFRTDSLRIEVEGKGTYQLDKYKMNYFEYSDLMGWNTKSSAHNDSKYAYVKFSEQKKDQFYGEIKRAIDNNLPLIIDARKYPSKLFVAQLAKYFSHKPKDVAYFYMPLKNYPGFYKKTKNYPFYFTNTADLVLKSLYVLPSNWNLFYPLTKQVKSKVVVLISEETKSWGETMVLILKNYPSEVTLIGRNTAGTNGNIGVAELAGNLELNFTHYRIEEVGGTNYQQTGIPPDIFVKQQFPSKENQTTDRIFQTALDYLFNDRAVKK